MFGYCLWYHITNYQIIQIINKLANIFNTTPYNPHLTIFYNKSLEESKILFDKLKQQQIPSFNKFGKVYQTSNNNFYALQQDFKDTKNYITFRGIQKF